MILSRRNASHRGTFSFDRTHSLGGKEKFILSDSLNNVGVASHLTEKRTGKRKGKKTLRSCICKHHKFIHSPRIFVQPPLFSHPQKENTKTGGWRTGTKGVWGKSRPSRKTLLLLYYAR